MKPCHNEQNEWPKMMMGQHAACCLGFGTDCPHLLISGGRIKQETVLEDMWILDINKRQWKLVRTLKLSRNLQSSDSDNFLLCYTYNYYRLIYSTLTNWNCKDGATLLQLLSTLTSYKKSLCLEVVLITINIHGKSTCPQSSPDLMIPFLVYLVR